MRLRRVRGFGRFGAVRGYGLRVGLVSAGLLVLGGSFSGAEGSGRPRQIALSFLTT